LLFSPRALSPSASGVEVMCRPRAQLPSGAPETSPRMVNRQLPREMHFPREAVAPGSPRMFAGPFLGEVAEMVFSPRVHPPSAVAEASPQIVNRQLPREGSEVFSNARTPLWSSASGASRTVISQPSRVQVPLLALPSATSGESPPSGAPGALSKIVSRQLSSPRVPLPSTAPGASPQIVNTPLEGADLMSGTIVNGQLPRDGAEFGSGDGRRVDDDAAEFVISIDRASLEDLWGVGASGAELKANKFLVEEVRHPSVLSSWNKSNPDQRVSAGDSFIEVNGRTNAQDMRQQLHVSTVLNIRVRPFVVPQDFDLWQEAAKDFELNSDFDISEKLEDAACTLGLAQLMTVMKGESAEKSTIQAMGDKIFLHRLLDNMTVPQMPLLFSTQCKAQLPEVQELVDRFAQADENGDTDAFDFVAKPTHLSNAAGALLFSKRSWLAKGYSAEKLVEHIDKYLAEKAAVQESEALQSLIPGFIVQPRYRSCVEFTAPLEMRIVTLWGKARVGIWWWGRQVVGATPVPNQKPQRTAWLFRKNDAIGFDNSEESWEAYHEHKGDNKGFDSALQLFIQAMPAMAAAAESIAKALGAPFLRSDFFVGSEKWGVRLNEVAYGSGVDCRRKVGGTNEVVDDAPVIARILQEGFKHCNRKPAKYFMDSLGVEGDTYKSMVVTKLDEIHAPKEERKRPRLSSFAIRAFDSVATDTAPVSPVAASQCETPHNRQDPAVNTPAIATPAVHVQQPLSQVTLRGLPMPVRSACVAVPVGLPQVMPVMKQVLGYPHGLCAPSVPLPLEQSRLRGYVPQSPVLLGRSVCHALPLAPISEHCFRRSVGHARVPSSEHVIVSHARVPSSEHVVVGHKRVLSSECVVVGHTRISPQ